MKNRLKLKVKIDMHVEQCNVVAGVARAFKKWSDQEVGVVIL